MPLTSPVEPSKVYLPEIAQNWGIWSTVPPPPGAFQSLWKMLSCFNFRAFENDGDKCVQCEGKVYEKERIVSPRKNLIFHKECFLCHFCRKKLDGTNSHTSQVTDARSKPQIFFTFNNYFDRLVVRIWQIWVKVEFWKIRIWATSNLKKCKRRLKNLFDV